MADRAQFLARTLISRLADVHARAAEDGGADPDRAARLRVVEKVLAVELGVVDGTLHALIEAAVPVARAARRPTDAEIAALAEFLRRRLGVHLEV